MRCKTVKIELQTEDDQHYFLWITWNELSTLVGCLNIVNDLREAGAEISMDWFNGAVVEQRFGGLDSIITSQEVQILTQRLSTFVRDRGLIG